MKIHVEFDMNIENGCSYEEIEEWLRFELNDNGQMSTKNPLCGTEIEPIFPSLFWEEE